jgi:hypothetical protein
VPQEQDKQALLCSKVFQSFGPSGDNVCSAQYSITGKPPPISGVSSFVSLNGGIGWTFWELTSMRFTFGLNLLLKFYLKFKIIKIRH